MSRLLAIPLLVVSLSVAVWVASSASPMRAAATPTPLGVNLLANPSFELPTSPKPDGYEIVPIPRWTKVGHFTITPYGIPNVPSVAEGKRIGGGRYFTYGGDTARSQLSQVVALTGRNRQVDGIRLKVTASVYMCGYGSQGDNGQLIVQFLDANRELVGTAHTARVSGDETTMRKKTVTANVPAGTRFLKVVLVAVRTEGTYNDASFDRPDLRLALR